MNSIRTLLQYLKPYKWLAVKNMAYNILSAFFALFTFTLIVPFLQILFKRVAVVPDPGAFTFSAVYIKNYVNWLFSSSIDKFGEARTLLLVVIIFAISSIIKNLFVFLSNNCMASLRAGTVRDVEEKFMTRYFGFPYLIFLKHVRVTL